MSKTNELVECPNMCISGKVKHHQSATQALYDLVNCPYCKGEGEVTKEEAKRIDALI